MHDLIVRLKRQFSFPGKTSKRNGRHHAFRSVSLSETRSKTPENIFNAKVKLSLKRYTSERGPAKSKCITSESAVALSM